MIGWNDDDGMATDQDGAEGWNLDTAVGRERVSILGWRNETRVRGRPIPLFPAPGRGMAVRLVRQWLLWILQFAHPLDASATSPANLTRLRPNPLSPSRPALAAPEIGMRAFQPHRSLKPGRPSVPCEGLADHPRVQHGLVTALAENFHAHTVAEEIVDRSDDAGAHPPALTPSGRVGARVLFRVRSCGQRAQTTALQAP